MSVLPPDTVHQAGACQADSGCERVACFQALVEATAGHKEIGRRANACGRHLADVVQALSAWARDSVITEGWLTVLAVDPCALPRPDTPGGPPRPAENGFAFYRHRLTWSA